MVEDTHHSPSGLPFGDIDAYAIAFAVVLYFVAAALGFVLSRILD